MRDGLGKISKNVEQQSKGGSKTFALTQEALASVEDLRGEFEFLKTRFSPAFVQRVDKALANFQTIAYDVEVVKMTTSHVAMKKDLD